MAAVTATRLRGRTGETLDAVQFGGARMIVTRRGRPAAALVPVADLQLLEGFEDGLDAAAADEAASDPDNQERIPWEHVKAASRALTAADRADAEDIERVLADPDEEWTPLEDVLAEAERLP